MEARWLTVGPVQENTWIARREGAKEALLIDPGDEPDTLKTALRELDATVAAILITHCHFDHVGAVAEMARSTGAPVYCPAGEVFILENINDFVRFPGFGPFESYSPEETVADGDRLELAGFEIDVIGTPGHSPDHVTYSIADEKAIFSGDVLFQGSIGRTDLPGADHATLMALDRQAARHAPGRDRRAARPHAAHDARRASARATRSCTNWREQALPDAARHVRRAARDRARPRPAGGDRAQDPRARRLRPDRDADLRGHGAVRARRGGGHRRRAEGDVHASATRRTPTRCGRRARRRSCAPTWSTACTSCRSR